MTNLKSSPYARDGAKGAEVAEAGGEQSVEGESPFYRYLLQHHKMPSVTDFTCSECKNFLMDYQDRYHCLECKYFDLCPECALKQELENANGHIPTHRHKIIPAGEDETE